MTNEATNLLNSEINSTSQELEIANTSQDTSLNIPDIADEEEQDDRIKIYDSLEEFNNNLPDTVTLLNTPSGNTCYLGEYIRDFFITAYN